jgi:streptogramin lyase
VIPQSHLIAVVGVLLIAVVVVGCGSGPGNIDNERGGEGDAATNEETTAPKGDRSAAGTAQEEPVGFDEEVVSPLGQANVPAGFGEGSLWATGAFGPGTGCDDVIGDSASASAEAEASCGGGGLGKTHLKRVDPRTGEVVTAIPFEGSWGTPGLTEVAVGAGSVWVSHGEYTGPRPARSPLDFVHRVDPRTNRVVDRIPVDSPTGLDFGFGSVWVTSPTFGTLSRIDPRTGEVVAKIDVDRGAVEVAVDESSGAVWVAGLSSWKPKPENNKLSRVDPETNRVVAEIPIRADARDGGADNVAVGEGAVWVLSVDGRLLKVDPETNEVAGMVSVGYFAWDSPLVVYGDGVWTMVQTNTIRLVRADPSTMDVVAYEDLKPFYSIAPGALAAGGGYLWFSSGKGLARVAP